MTAAVGALFAAPAHAAEPAPTAPVAVASGELTWGVSSPWRAYITGPIANGQILAQEPATVAADGQGTWTGAAGEVDLAAGTGSVTYAGGLTFQGHAGLGPDGGYALDQTLAAVRVELTSPTTAVLSAEVTQPGAAGFPTYAGERVEMADLVFADGDLLDGAVTATATLTDAGADVYARTNADFQPGARLDDVSFGIDAAAPVPEPATPTALALSAAPATACAGDAVTLTARVAPAVAGTIRFSAGSTVVGEARVDATGAATLGTTTLATGEHAPTARFTPDDDAFAASAASAAAIVVLDCAEEPAARTGSLEWGVKASFRDYVVGAIAHGDIAATQGASQASGNGAFTFPQASSGTAWDGSTGSAQYAGQVRFRGHDGVLDVTLANPTVRVTSASRADLVVAVAGGDRVTIAAIDLASGRATRTGDDGIRVTSARTTLTAAGAGLFSYDGSAFYPAGQELDRISFTVGADGTAEVADPPAASPAPAPTAPAAAAPEPAAATSGPAAGALEWGVSSAFVAYTTCEGADAFGYAHCANGTVSTSGVGAGYVFPQATGGDWDPETGTGTVQYSGVVRFSGYGMTMFEVANPSITVGADGSATLYTGNTAGFGSASYPLDLSGATRTTGDAGEVTFAGARVGGSLTGGPSADNAVGFDDVTFTVGSASTASYAATAAGATEDEEEDNEAPEEDPAVRALDASACVVTDATLDWGVKESFRAYISGTIANGSWETSAGATYDTPTFSFTGGTGSVDPDTGAGTVSFPGEIHFTGHDGVLDLTLANPTLAFDGPGTATLLVDARSTGMDGETAVDERQAAVADVNLGGAAPGDDVTDAAVTLTAAGADAFAGFYAAGETLDPVSATFEVADCAPAAAAGAEASAAGAAGAAPEAPLPWLPLGLGGAALLVAGLGAGFLLGRRRPREGAAS
nr:HtaA domain-containing protein [Microbacterium excoecariae]